jgi:hypothetical protein
MSSQMEKRTTRKKKPMHSQRQKKINGHAAHQSTNKASGGA